MKLYIWGYSFGIILIGGYNFGKKLIWGYASTKRLRTPGLKAFRLLIVEILSEQDKTI
jgi:hypothetical protein